MPDNDLALPYLGRQHVSDELLAADPGPGRADVERDGQAGRDPEGEVGCCCVGLVHLISFLLG